MNRVDHAKRPGRSSKWIRRTTRYAIYARDGFRCVTCTRRLRPHERSLDHVIPQSVGGPHTPDNLITSCRSCNCRRQHGPVPAPAVARVRAALLTPISPVHRRRGRAILDMERAADTMAVLAKGLWR